MTIACFIPTISVGSTLTHVRYYLDDPVHLLESIECDELRFGYDSSFDKEKEYIINNEGKVNESMEWRVTKFEETHNHDLILPKYIQFVLAYRTMTDADKAQADSLHF
ncbi:hypothetical protein AHAS_Ahas02G0185000 [Arachis hypogaea]